MQFNRLHTQDIQKFGRFLSGMVMPNIGAFIAWGLLTALFVPNGWWPDESLAQLVEPMIFYLLPLLIGYTGGKLVYGQRGGVLGSIATIGMIVSTSIPMFAGAMIVGPFAGWVIKKCDEVITSRIPTGFEMLANNFSAGIVGALLAVSTFEVIGPIVELLDAGFGLFVEKIISAGALPFISVFVEPAKILFLNNAINHGVFSPLGIGQAIQTGESIFFLIETNPGPGLGILLVYFVFGKGTSKRTAPGAIVIHFFGGIHEIYFPYILMQPKLLLAVIAGGASGVFTFSLLDAGLIAVPSPGSIITVIAMTQKGGLLPVLSGVLVSTLVTFFVGAFLIDRKAGEKDDALAGAKEQMFTLKGVKTAIGHESIPDEIKTLSNVKLIAVACDAGMGSSAMGASKLRGVFSEAGIDLKVISCPIDQLDRSVDLVITHEKLTPRAVSKLPESIHIAITSFIETPVYQELGNRLAEEKNRLMSRSVEEGVDEYPVLRRESIKLALDPMTKEEAILLAGKVLYEAECVEQGYAEAMLEREIDCSTYMGNGVAIPHGTSEGRSLIKRTGICILQFPDGIDFDGNTTYLVVGIAAAGNQHLSILSVLAKVIEEEKEINRLKSTNDPEYIYQRFSGVSETEETIINNPATNLVIFDCDGVLVDSEIIAAKILVECMQSLDIHIDFEYVQQNFLGRSFSNVINHTNGDFNVVLPENFEEIYRQKLLERFTNELQPIEGIIDILSHLSVDYCLASSSSKERINNSLENTSLTRWFSDRIFSADEVKNGKPAPDLFLHAARIMGYEPQNCLVIEDSRSGIQAGISAGMEVMHFVGGSHLKDKRAQILADQELNIPVITEWSEFFEQRPDLKKPNNEQ